MLGERDGEKVLAEHGRWVARLRDDVKMLDQRLHTLERRVMTIESNLVELRKLYSKLDLALSSGDDLLERFLGGMQG